MLHIWLVIPLALSFLSLLTGLRIDFHEQMARAAGDTQVLETLEFWVKHRGDKGGLPETLEILRDESGYSALGLCYRDQILVKVGDLRGTCGRSTSSSWVSGQSHDRVKVWQKNLKGAGPYSVIAESQAFSSLAGLMYFLAFVLFLSFGLLSFIRFAAERGKKPHPAARPVRARLCLHNENQLEI